MDVSELRFGNLPRSMQTLIFAALVVCPAFVFYAHYLKDLLAERDLIQAEIEKLELSVSQETATDSQLRCLKQELEHLKKRFEALKSILPLPKETPAVLRSVQQMAASSNLKINRLTPKPVVSRTFYSDWPIRIEVAGNYSALGLFFEKVSRATRIIAVGTISIKGSENPTDTTRTLTASFTATTFVFREELPETTEENEAP